ncbi:F-box domain-containing protein [Citrus sinensis]|nr:FBD-associated F-box protein At4g10400-like isoform X3 [Citrus sinensis]KAH9652974.1 F-box domain-containing protein [Citrus sinensis]
MRKRPRNTPATREVKQGEIVEDLMSLLPDDILINIISRLPLKEAAKTSVLSSRWKYLWTFTTVLDFDGITESSNCISDPTCIDKVLQLHRGSSINKFRLCLYSKDLHESEITNWVYSALSKRVQIFELELWPRLKNYTFLENCYNNLKSELSGVKYLRSLRLFSVNVTGEILEFILHNCPLLDQLSVVRSETLVSLKVVGSAIQLKHLRISTCYRLNEIKISTPNLLSFKYFGPGQELKLHIENAPQLVDISFRGVMLTRVRNVVGPITSCFPQLKTLELDSCDELYAQFSEHELPNLTHLHLRVATLNRESLLGLASIMKACPFLQTLIVQFDYNGYKVGRRRKVPRHSHQHLKLVELHGFLGRPIDLELAFYILENAMTLEKMVVNRTNYSFGCGNAKDCTKLREAKLRQGVELLVL